jgi:hypothetical protein
MSKKKYISAPCEHYSNQLIEITGQKIDRRRTEIWINTRRNKDRGSLCLNAEEAVEFAKLLYRIAYDLGYKPKERFFRAYTESF